MLRDVSTWFPSVLIGTILKPTETIKCYFTVLTVINKLLHHIRLWFVVDVLYRTLFSYYHFGIAWVFGSRTFVAHIWSHFLLIVIVSDVFCIITL